MKKQIFLVLYYSLAKYLPASTFPVLGNLSKKIRGICCRIIFKKVGENINIDRNVYFGNGKNIEIGNNSGIGRDSHVTNNLIIGNDVMIAPELIVLGKNHNFNHVDIPMSMQGVGEDTQVVIGDDVWIGRRVILTNKSRINTGSIIASGSVVTKEFEKFSIVGGNPARVIKSRL